MPGPGTKSSKKKKTTTLKSTTAIAAKTAVPDNVTAKTVYTVSEMLLVLFWPGLRL
jgi:hypothetical protein